MNGYLIAAAAGLWWVSRKRAHREKAACGCKNRAILNAAEPQGGTDCNGNWWQRLHGADLMHSQFKNYSGVSMDPSSTDKVTLASVMGVSWNGDATK